MFIHSLSIHNPQAVWIKFRPKNPAAAAPIESFASLFKGCGFSGQRPESSVATDEILFLNPGVRPGIQFTCRSYLYNIETGSNLGVKKPIQQVGFYERALRVGNFALCGARFCLFFG